MASSRSSDTQEHSSSSSRSQISTPTPYGGSRRRSVFSIMVPTPLREHKFTLTMRGLFVFQMTSELYVTLRHLLPWFLEETSAVSLLFPRMVILYMFLVMFINWVCIIWYSCEYTPPTDRRDAALNGVTPTSSRRFPNDHDAATGMDVTVDVTEKGGLPWGHCERCQMDTPPRTVHCRVCQACILRRDHHCYLVGSCIGHWNQRFFVAMAANSMLMGSLALYLTLGFLYDRHSWQESLWNYCLPVTVAKWVWGGVSGQQALLTFHAYMLSIFTPIGAHYFATQTCLIASGRTKREVKRRVKVVVTSSVCANLRLAFGYCWWLSLLLPLPHLLFPQTHQGLHYDNVKMSS